MSILSKILLTLLISFFIGMLISKLVILIAKKFKAGQKILSYVTQHKGKDGTPTFGGFIFIIPTLITAVIFKAYETSFGFYILLVLISYAIIGFLDDFIKIKTHKNEGLKPYQKIISQVAIAGLVSYFAYSNPSIGSEIKIPILNLTANLKIFYIPFSMFMYLALSNGVNLTDGLDGLAGTTTLTYNMTYLIIMIIGITSYMDMGNSILTDEYLNMAIINGALIGGLLAFLWQNIFKAKIFMGDTGSLALGGVAATFALFTQNPLLAMLIGIIYVLSCISVIVQVIYYKVKKKRIFLMAPLHHHLELSGHNESKIVGYYFITTFIAGVVSIIIM